jgi:hypothetical protein
VPLALSGRRLKTVSIQTASLVLRANLLAALVVDRLGIGCCSSRIGILWYNTHQDN